MNIMLTRFFQSPQWLSPISSHSVASIPGLRVLGDPQVSVIAFTSDVFDIYQLAELMSRNSDGSPNWSLNALQYPPAVHFCVTDVHTQPGLAQRFLDDLRDAAERLIKEPKKEVTGMVSLDVYNSLFTN